MLDLEPVAPNAESFFLRDDSCSGSETRVFPSGTTFGFPGQHTKVAVSQVLLVHSMLIGGIIRP